MLQAIVKKGKIFADNIPPPRVSHGAVLVRVVNSSISAGTEISGVNSSGKTLMRRMLDQPELAQKAFDFARSQGIAKLLKKARLSSDEAKPTGYSIAGVIVGVGSGVTGFAVGDAVAAAGAGIANHAEFVDVPVNLVVRIPVGVSFSEASTVAIGAIAMQGVRRCELTLGEFCVVIGTGLLGLLAVQMLHHAGVRVIAIDVNRTRLRLAQAFGAELTIDPSRNDAIRSVENLTGGFGSDAILFTASTSSSEPISDAFKMCKRKGRVILVGVAGLVLKREDMFAKELDFRLSTSYGPGRYDAQYEEKGMEYPYAYIRWTENRNMSEYLRLLATGSVKIDKMIHRIYPIEKVGEAFAALADESKKPILIVLEYRDRTADKREIARVAASPITGSVRRQATDVVRVGLVGAGAFAAGVHLPNLARLGTLFRLDAVVDSTGLRAQSVADQYGARLASTEISDILSDIEIDLVMITTRHDSHARLVLQALNAGKHVFVEKPMATNYAELATIKKFYSDGQGLYKPVLMVGFNRRFSKFTVEIAQHTKDRINPLFVHYRMNAGHLPSSHWVHESGGRMVGEVCHIVDLLTYLTGSRIESMTYESLRPSTDRFTPNDNKSIVLKYQDGSVCTIEYFATGNKGFPKEYMEIHFDGKTIVLDDYKKLRGYGVDIRHLTSATAEKGQLEELQRLHRTISGQEKAWPIELWDMVQTTEITFNLV